MNTNLLGNLEGNTPKVKIDNGNRRQGRSLHVLFMLVMMMGWGVSGAWGATVTYHIINLGRLDDSGQLTTSTRTEALRFTSSSLIVGLPNQYKSPLAKNWKYYTSDEITYDEETKAYTFAESTTLVEGTSVLSDGDHVYVTYVFDEEALSTVGLFDGSICKIEFNLTNQYLQQTVWEGDPNTGSYALQEDPSFYWKVNIKDPYQITIQSQSTTYLDYYLSADAGKFADIRLKTPLSTAITNKVWAFGLLPDAPTNTYRLIVTDGYTYHPNQDGIDQFGHGHLNNNDIKNGVRKTRYQKYSGSSYSNCALTFVPLTKTYIIVNNLGETLVQATTTDYPLEVPDVIKSPFASYTYYSTQADAIAGTNPINSVTSTTIYVRYTTSSSSLDLNGGTGYYVRTNDNYWYAASATTMGIESMATPSDDRKWTLNGNDAYQITIQNVGNSKYVTYDVSSGEAVPTLSATGSKFFLHQSNTGQYEVVAITPSDHTTSYYSMGVANNTLKLYSNNNYPLGEAEVQSAFSTQAVCATPVITYDFSSKKVTITTSTTGATIYYTLTGENPDPAMPAGGNTLQYDPQSEPTVTSRTVVKAIAVKTDFINSQIARTTIVTNPTFQLAAGPYIYNRSAHTPLLHVNDVYGNTDLTDVIDPAEYTVTYSNNVNAGTATITITDNPDGNYIVNGSTTFTIEPMSIGTGGTPVSGITITVDSNGSEYLVTVKHGSVTLTEGESNDYTWQVTGSDEVTVTGHNNYTGSAKGHYVSVTPGYYALHKNNVGYLKRYSDNVTLGNENTFRYGNSFDNNGSSIWIITPEGYLQSDYYYLNVANGSTLYLSVTPQTQWKTNDIEGNEHEKKQLKTTIGGVDYYLCNNNGTIQLTTNQTIAYNACPIAITEADENGWSGPTVNTITVQSPQQITYLRNCYFTQKMSYEFYDDGGTRKSEDNKDRRVFVKLTFNSSTDANQGSKWQVDASNGILYLKNTQTSEYTIPATYDVVPADPFVPAAHLAAVQTNISFKLQPKTIKPSSELNKNYILFSIYGGDNFRYPYDSVTLQENDPVKPNGKGGTGNDSDLSDPGNNGIAKISWIVEMDPQGFYSFRNSRTNRYLYFDENEYTYSDFGTLKVGSTSPSTDDTRYKFRFFKTSNSGGFGTCYYIIPYSKQFVVFKNDGVSASICAALNIADYSNQTTPVISLHQSVDNSKWLIYKYEAEYRVRKDFVLSGPSATYNTTDDNIFSTEDCWYGKCIKESPTTGNLQRSMVVSGSYNTTNLLNYIWTVDGLNDYISISGGTSSGTQTTITINSTPTFNLDVISLPVSAVTGTVELKLKGGNGGTHPYKTSDPKTLLFTIYGDGNVQLTVIHSLSAINDQFGTYQLAADANVAYSESNKPGVETFSGILDCNGLTVTGLTAPLFTTLTNGKVYNLNLKGVKINGSGPTGAIADTANGASRIYNCGILPTTTLYDENGNISGFAGDTISSSDGYCGSIVGLLDGYARVINCFSYATIAGGSTVAGIVGYNNQTSNMNSLKTIVVNCMYYGEITGGTTTYPVYGGKTIVNNGTTAINNYNYYRGESTFDNNYGDISNYNRSWPAEEKDLRRFEYYRSILNSNRRLCTWWVDGIGGVAPTDVDIANVGIAKWVLDPSKAPYPILKPWGKYPSIINTDTTRIWNWKSGQWVQRINAPDYQGKKLGELTITVKAGSHPMTLGLSTSERTETLEHVVITDMDTLNYDYCYGKVQLPYYNEVFGNSASTNHLQRYYGNYTNKVVTAWKITAVTTDGSVQNYNEFVHNWENGYNYADRYCKDKDIYDLNDGRAFAQGGYYYVPVGVTAITIEAYWGDAFYLQGKDNALDRVSVCAYNDNGSDNKNYGFAFTPAGTLPTTINYTANGTNHSVSVYNDFKTLINAVKADRTKNVYEQAVVLVGNFPFQAQNDFVGTGDGCLGNTPDDGKYGGFTFMSADFDMDNEPDFCFPFQWRNNVSRYPVMPIRFDFLPIPNLGLTMRHNTYAYAVGIMVPQGHFEMTETAFWYTTQFEPMSESVNVNHQQPLILNGGQYEQFVSHSDHKWTLTFTRNIIMGGHIWMKRFSPGSHAGRNCYVRHCAVSVMGGEFPEFYLTGIYWTEVDVSHAYDDNPHCYTNGGRFGLMAGAGMEAVKNSVYFEIDHSVIEEFYGGGINGNNPVNDSINVTINNSLVLEKYCGGPKIGESKAVTTYANNTVFCGDYFGGGNGGTNLYREKRADQTPNNMPTDWGVSPYDFHLFKPISNQGDVATYDADLGYHAEFEFEVFNQSNGVGSDAVARTYIHWAQFGTTTTKNVVNELSDCTVKRNFYGGGNLGTVDGTTISSLTDCTILGNVFGAGFSATIPSFPVHDKSKVTFPYRDKAGVCHNGTVGYRTDGMGDDAVVRNYTWCYKNTETGKIVPETVTEIPNGVDTDKPAFKEGDNWYCYTKKSLENLGVVTSNVTLTIKGKSTIGTFENGMVKHGTGNVFGGGDESAVGGSTLVKILDRTRVFGNIYGGGNRGQVGGDTKVIINGTVPDETPTGNANNNNPNH